MSASHLAIRLMGIIGSRNSEAYCCQDRTILACLAGVLRQTEPVRPCTDLGWADTCSCSCHCTRPSSSDRAAERSSSLGPAFVVGASGSDVVAVAVAAVVVAAVTDHTQTCVTDQVVMVAAGVVATFGREDIQNTRESDDAANPRPSTVIRDALAREPLGASFGRARA